MSDPGVLAACAISTALSAFAIWSGQASVAGIGFTRVNNPRMFWVAALAPVVLAVTALAAVAWRGGGS